MLFRSAKNLIVGEGKSQYKAVGEADVLAAVKPLEAKYKVYSYPASRRVISDAVMESETTYKDTVKKTNKMFLRIETIYRFVNMEKPDEFVEVVTYGDGVDPQDKAPGKAMTYADKYALLKAYKIQTGDDPDQHYSEPFTSMKGTLICSKCGAEIDEKVYDYSMDRYFVPLCRDCQKRA